MPVPATWTRNSFAGRARFARWTLASIAAPGAQDRLWVVTPAGCLSGVLRLSAPDPAVRETSGAAGAPYPPLASAWRGVLPVPVHFGLVRPVCFSRGRLLLMSEAPFRVRARDFAGARSPASGAVVSVTSAGSRRASSNMRSRAAARPPAGSGVVSPGLFIGLRISRGEQGNTASTPVWTDSTSRFPWPSMMWIPSEFDLDRSPPMKLPASKRKQIAKTGRSLPEASAGGGARARQQQFEKQRGVKRPGKRSEPAAPPTKDKC